MEVEGLAVCAARTTPKLRAQAMKDAPAPAAAPDAALMAARPLEAGGLSTAEGRGEQGRVIRGRRSREEIFLRKPPARSAGRRGS